MTRTEELLRKVNEVRERLETEGLNPGDYHCLGIARDICVDQLEWADALVMNKWINNNNETKEV